MKIKKITKKHFSGHVHNIGVQENHTYFAEGVLVHNCYQGSTKKGKHGDTQYIIEVLKALAQAECFEASLGGGETTSHPDFALILKTAHDLGIKPSFTSFNTDWMKNEEIAQAVTEYCGGFAISVQHDEEEKFAKVLNDMKAWKERPVQPYGNTQEMVIQAVAELNGTDGITKLIETMTQLEPDSTSAWDRLYPQLTLTVLGYKYWGRGTGKGLKEFDLEKVIYRCRKAAQALSIDTTIVNRYPDALKNEHYAKLITDSEGAFSCYIDAVDQVLAPSSYDATKIPLKENIYENLKNNFPFPGLPNNVRTLLTDYEDPFKKAVIADAMEEQGYTAIVKKLRGTK